MDGSLSANRTHRGCSRCKHCILGDGVHGSRFAFALNAGLPEPLSTPRMRRGTAAALISHPFLHPHTIFSLTVKRNRLGSCNVHGRAGQGVLQVRSPRTWDRSIWAQVYGFDSNEKSMQMHMPRLLLSLRQITQGLKRSRSICFVAI